MQGFRALSLLTLLLIIVSCQNSDTTAVVAQVGNTTLTAQNIAHELGSGASTERQKEYVRQWIDRELLYQQAYADGIHKESEVASNLEETEKNLLSMLYLNRNVDSDSVVITNDEVEEYFNQNRADFLRQDDVIRFAVYSLNTMRDAWSIRGNLTTSNFISSSRRYSKSEVIPVDDILFVEKSSLPEELREKLFEIRVDGITTPIRVGEYVNLYLILDKGEAGTESTLEEAFFEVRNKLMTEKYQEKVNSVLAEVRDGHDFSYNHEYFDSTENEGTDVVPVSVRREDENE